MVPDAVERFGTSGAKSNGACRPMPQMTDNGDEPLPLRCHPGKRIGNTGAGAPGVDGRTPLGMALQTFSIGAIFPLLHQQRFDVQQKQKVPTGHLNNLLIPDTVVFRVGHAGHPLWYMSSVSEPGVIKRKNSNNVTPRNILEAFTRRKAKRPGHNERSSGIIAVLISDSHQSENITEQDQIGSATVEYLDEVLLRDFLERRAVSFSGLLQRWVDPKGQNNSMLHATWTPKMCKITCLTNVRSMSDRRTTMYERAVTFDGADSFTRRDPVSSTLHNHITHLCASIATHVADITDGECVIDRCTSYFKVRSDGKVVYLWSSSLRVNAENTVGNRVAVSGNAPLTTRSCSPILGVPHQMDVRCERERERSYVCPVSNKVCSWNDAKTFITYKMIIQEWNSNFPSDAASQENFRPSSARFRPSSAGTPRQAPPEARRSAGATSMSAHAAPAHDEHSEQGNHARSEQAGGEHGEGAGRAVYVRKQQVGATVKPALSAQNCVPELIRKLENINDADLYQRLLKDPAFLYKQVRVCSEVARAYSKVACAQQSTVSAADCGGQRLGQFLDHLPLDDEDGGRHAAHHLRALSVRTQQAGKAKSQSARRTSQAVSASSLEHEPEPHRQQGEVLPKLPLGALGARLHPNCAGQQAWGELASGRENGGRGLTRHAEDLEQHKRRLESARAKAEGQTANRRMQQLLARDKGRPLSHRLARCSQGINIFTDWKKECKNDDRALDSLKLRAAGISTGGALTERVRSIKPQQEDAAAVPRPPLSARPPNGARHGHGVRGVVTGGVVVEQQAQQPVPPGETGLAVELNRELAYHRAQAALQKRFLDQMIVDTKLRLNLGGVEAQDASAMRQAGAHEGFGAAGPVLVSATADPHGGSSVGAEDAGGACQRHQAAGRESSDSQDGTDDVDADLSSPEETGCSLATKARLRDARCEQSVDGGSADCSEFEESADEWSDDEASEARDPHAGSAASEGSGPSVEDRASGDALESAVNAATDERVLAALHMATDEAPEKHRRALQGILPELESEEQQYFLNVITDLGGYMEDAALQATIF